MGRGVPAHVHAEAILPALLEACPAGLTVVQVMAATPPGGHPGNAAKRNRDIAERPEGPYGKLRPTPS